MRLKKLFKSIGSAMALAVVALALSAVQNVYAASSVDASVKLTEIDYEKSIIKVKLNDADSALLISDGKQKKWEYAPVIKGSDNTVELDISWISVTNDYTLSLRGDVSATPIKVIIPKQTKNFKVTYSTLDGGKLSFQNATGKVQWKKKDALNWEDFPTDASGAPDTTAFRDRLLGMCPNGATLLFRLAPEKGTSVTAVGKRASKEVSVSVAKKLAAPAIKVDDEKMTIAVSKDMQYRYCDSYGNPYENGTLNAWNDFGKSYDCPLSDIAGKAMISTENPSPSDVYIQFRTKASSTKQMSNVTTVKIPAQRDLTAAAKEKIKLVYTSTTTFQIEIAAASADEPYEYCILNKKDLKEGVDIDNVREIQWKTVNSQSPVSISESKNKVENGSKVYVRRKALKELGNDDYEIASPYMFLGEVMYPKDITTLQSGLIWLQTVAGRCNPDNSSGKLNFTFFSETNSPITQIRFVDYSSTGTDRGTLKINDDFTSVVSKNTEYDASVTDTTDAKHYQYIINTTIFSTAKLDSVAVNNKQREMLAYIKIKDSDEEFKSDSEKGIALYMHPATVVNNPSSPSAKEDIATKLGWTGYSATDDYIPYATTFERVYGSTWIYKKNNGYAQYMNKEACDDTKFRVRLDIGTRYVPKSNTKGTVSSTEKVEITKIKYDGVEFLKNATDSNGNKYFEVEYADIKGTTTDNTGDEQRMAVLTVNVDVIEKNVQIDDRDKETPLLVYLSNGEVIKDSLKINLKNTAIIVDSESKVPGAQSLTINDLLKLEDKTIITGASGQTEEKVTEHPDDYHICLKKFRADYGVSLDRVTWNGKSICRKISSASEYITMDISNKMLNDIYSSITPGSSESAYLVFEFDNGFKITTGWKITFNRPANS